MLDPRGRWEVGAESKVVRLAGEGRGLAPWVFVSEGADVREERRGVVEEVGGRFFVVKTGENGRLGWRDIFRVLGEEGIGSVMVEGGGEVINGLLGPGEVELVDSVIVTIAPVWLGKGGVMVVPEERRNDEGAKMAVGRLRDVRWVPLGEDVVLCGRP